MTLLCAEDVSPELAELMDALHAEDIDFDYVAGVDLDSKLALCALERHGDDAFYVICQDEYLDEYAAEHLRTHLARVGPFARRQSIVLRVRATKAWFQAKQLADRAERSRRPGPPPPPPGKAREREAARL